MTPGPDTWGTRLGDAVRAALTRGDREAARHLARHGDGQARDLAREFAFMVRGLGFTLQVLLGLLLKLPVPGPAAEADLLRLLARLLKGLQGGAVDAGADAGPPATAPAPLAQACLQALATAQARFSSEQARLADAVVAALAAGPVSPVLRLLDDKDRDYLALHDPMVRFMADSFAWVLRHHGESGLLDFHLATAEGQRAGFEKWEQMPAAEFAATTAFLLKQHMGQVQVLEDDQRFTIHQSPCGSGGRLQREGAYDPARAGGQALPFVEHAGPLTFGAPRMPVYCTHCAIWNGSATLRWFGRAQWVFEQPARADGGCTMHIYKRREDAPADYTRRVALPAGKEPT
ncbi:MAG: hypothetical protein HY855_16410 [Burkholderiales bacterium]|nr:hypothetical protein [Burkholderiales bacterium]